MRKHFEAKQKESIAFRLHWIGLPRGERDHVGTMYCMTCIDMPAYG